MSTETSNPEGTPEESAAQTASETDQTSGPAASSSAAQSESEAPSKPRNPVERAVVWTVIAVLGVLALIELRAFAGYTSSRRALESFMDKNPDAEQTLAEAKELLALAPTETKPEGGKKAGVYTYEWFSLFKSGQYVIKLPVMEDDLDDEKKLIVLGFETSDPPEPQPRNVADDGEGGNDALGGDDAAGGGPPPAHQAQDPTAVRPESEDAGADDAEPDDGDDGETDSDEPSPDDAAPDRPSPDEE